MVSKHQISCLCGSINQEVTSSGRTEKLQLDHSDTARHSSGILFTSHFPIDSPSLSDELRSWESAGKILYFCSTCGCHIFKERRSSTQENEWGVTTGTISSTTGGPHETTKLEHYAINETKDGGASLWINEFEGKPTASNKTVESCATPHVSAKAPSDALQGSCACGTVRFHVTRPDAASYEPNSNYPDLMYAYKTSPESLKINSNKDKWWIQGDGKKYMAGTCACRSCRLSTGFEVQTWAFVPRTNIFFHTKEDEMLMLDFATLPREILTTYNSSPGVSREFCGGCGATVFWHDTFRPHLIDISVGLFMAMEGARAESWLSWWTERVSFEEDAEFGREGLSARTARSVVTALEKGLVNNEPSCL